MTNLTVVDAHCDTITKLMATNEKLHTNNGHFDLHRANKYNSFVQFFAAFIHPDYCPDKAYQRCIDIIKHLEIEIAKNQEHIMLVRKYEDISDAIKLGKIAAVLTIENGGALEGDIKKLDEFYKLGVRSICLTWNGSNQLACGVRGDNLDGGLTPFGFDVVKRMNELRMLVDVSHINEASFWDVMNTSTSPIIASHSNSKTVCDHVRNLTDEQFKALVKNGGVTGMNLCPPFLNENEDPNMDDIVRHIEHFMSLGGENHVGMGADLDGISNTPKDVRGVEDFDAIFEALLRKNYSEEQVNKIAGLNFLRVLERVI